MCDRETKGQLLQRHKRELATLKKTGRQGKTAKEVKKLEIDLRAKHAKELEQFELTGQTLEISITEETKSNNNTEQTVSYDDTKVNAEPNKKPVSKAQRRRNAKAAKEKEIEQRIEEAKKTTVSKRDLETNALQTKLSQLKLTIKDVISDGNCLYYAISDQLKLVNFPKTYTNQQLRSLAAKYMRENAQEFTPFLESGEQFDELCTKIETTSAWGGQLEIRALVHSLHVPIIIHSADAPDVVMGEEYEEKQPLRLSFHNHYYSLGEHYNSVVPM